MGSNQAEPGFLWWRAGRYEIQADVLKSVEEPVPYILPSRRGNAWKELIDLHGAYSGESLNQKAAKAICSWCKQYGLPGYLLQTTESIFLPPVTHSGRQSLTKQTAIAYKRAGGRWITKKVTIRDDDKGEWGRPGPFAGYMERSDITRKPQPSVVSDSFMTFSIDAEAASSWFASSEPTIQERTSITRLSHHLKCAVDRCPQPGTEDFWKVYQEPVEDFFRAARLLSWIQSAIKEAETTGDPTAILSQLALSGWVKSPSGETAWTGASLLGAYASELLTGDSGVRRCIQSNCGTVFMPSRSDQKYCSERCRVREGKRKERRKQIKA